MQPRRSPKRAQPPETQEADLSEATVRFWVNGEEQAEAVSVSDIENDKYDFFTCVYYARRHSHVFALKCMIKGAECTPLLYSYQH